MREKINEKPEAVDDAIFSIIQYMADYDKDTAAAAPSFSNYDDDTTYYDTVIIELTIKNIDLPKNTRKTREYISFAYYKKFQTMVLKNMARTTSDNTNKLQQHGDFIIEQAKHNKVQQVNNAARVLILKDLQKLPINLSDKAKSKQIESAQLETKKKPCTTRCRKRRHLQSLLLQREVVNYPHPVQN